MSIFRDARYYYKGDVLYRDLFDVYAIHFIIKVTGEARQFDFILTCLCFGGGFGFLTIVSKGSLLNDGKGLFKIIYPTILS